MYVSFGQVMISELPPPASAPSKVTQTPQLIETGGKLVMRPVVMSQLPSPVSQAGFCWPVQGACFTSQQTKDRAQSMCRSGEKPTKIQGKGCPIGSPRIDTYGSFAETSASQFDPCLIQDFPVCSGGARFGDPYRFF